MRGRGVVTQLILHHTYDWFQLMSLCVFILLSVTEEPISYIVQWEWVWPHSVQLYYIWLISAHQFVCVLSLQV